jgi:hypothetical protein
VNTRRTLPPAIALSLVIPIATTGLWGCAREPVAPALTPETSIQELMVENVDPSVDELWNAVGTVETTAGVENRIPKDDEHWSQLRAHALRLVEIGNLLQIPGRRAVATDGAVPGAHIAGVLDHDEIAKAVMSEWPKFQGYARDFQVAAQGALQATRQHDAHALFEAGERLQQACEQCHVHFWYPGDRPPPDPATNDVVPIN